MTPRYTLWLEMLAEHERTVLALFLLAAMVVALVYNARRWRRQLLWPGVTAFWWTLAIFLLIKPPVLPRPTFGVLLGQPLWYDETFTVAVARFPLERMLLAVAGDVHPPLWYIVEWATIRLLGESAWAVRVPAMLFGLASVYLTYRLARALDYEHKTAMWAAGLLAVMPAQLFYAQEARMYTMLQFFVLLAVLGLYEHRYLLMSVGLAGALYTHNLSVLFVLVIGLLALRHWSGWNWRTYWQKAVLIGSGVFLLWVPWLRVVMSQVQAVGEAFWVQDCGPGGYLLPLYRLTLGMGTVNFIEQHAALAAAGLAALALWGALRDRYEGYILLALALGPALALALISEAWRPLYLERIFLAALPMLALLAASALRRLEPVYRAPVLAVLLPILFLCLLFQSKGTAGYDTFAHKIQAQYEKGDVIYHVNLASYILLSHYLPEAEHVCWPDAGNLQQALTVETQEAMGIRRADASKVWDGAGSLLVIWIENPMTMDPEVRALEAALELGQARKLFTWEESALVTAGVWRVTDKGNQDGEADD